MSLAPGFEAGYALLEKLIDACAFLHDDWTDTEGVGGWGQYTTNPLLLSPPVCITSPLEGFGEHTITHLRALGAFAGEIIQPAWVTNDLAYNLAQDQTAMRLLKRTMQSEGLHISTFYNDPERQIPQLAKALSTADHQVRVYPAQDDFIYAYNKLNFDRFTEGVPTPESALCTTLDELLAFANGPRSYPGLVVKMGHRDIQFIEKPSAVEGMAHHFAFPLRAETAYPLASSPIVHAVRFQGQCYPLFVIDQYVRDWLHWGNGSPAVATAAERQAIIAYTLEIGEQLGGYEGVFGVDYILTEDHEIYAVDINTRFCTSTYPYALLVSNGFNPDHVHTRFRLVPCRLDSLDDLTTDPAFTPLRAGKAHGTFLYCPVSYREFEHPVHYLNYVCVGETQADCLAVEAELLALIERKSAPNRAE